MVSLWLFTRCFVIRKISMNIVNAIRTISINLHLNLQSRQALKSPVPDFVFIMKSRRNNVTVEFLIICFCLIIQISFIHYFRDRIGLYRIVNSSCGKNNSPKYYKYIKI